jgi:RNA polymerase sigma factor (sigma-70 family)
MHQVSFGGMDEISLVEELSAGNRDAFKRLFSLYRRQVYNTCLGMLQHAEDAEDVTQEVFIEVFRSAGKFRGDSKISTWLYRIAYNRCLDHIRSKKRDKRSGEVVSIDGDATLQLAGNPSFVHPGVALEQKERATILFGAIAALPENQRVAFTLSKVDGLSYREIGEVMNMNQPGVESLIHRAKQNLKKLLENYYRNADT